jgi:hypothetical protein
VPGEQSGVCLAFHCKRVCRCGRLVAALPAHAAAAAAAARWQRGVARWAALCERVRAQGTMHVVQQVQQDRGSCSVSQGCCWRHGVCWGRLG